MKIKFTKVHEFARAPSYSYDNSVGVSLYAAERIIEVRKTVYDTGLKIEIPRGYVGLLLPRYSIHNTPLTLANSVGIIDGSKDESVKVVFKDAGAGPVYSVGDKIAQMIVVSVETCTFEEEIKYEPNKIKH